MKVYVRFFPLLIIPIVLILSSCKESGAKEVIYKINSISQFKNNLKGYWLVTDSNMDKIARPVVYTFDFDSENAGFFQDREETNEKNKYTVIMHAPRFNVSKEGDGFFIEFVPMFPDPNSNNKYKIESISNKRLILSNNKERKIYYKKTED